MVSLADLFQNNLSQYISERNCTKTPQKVQEKIPETGLLISYIKNFESALTERGLLPPTQNDSFNPIWFLAEMEQNVYLWRRGLSIADLNKFEFWVDVSALVTKRLNFLEVEDTDNPFLNPLWGTGITEKGTQEKERTYLMRFLDLYKNAETHLTALSLVQLVMSASTEENSLRLNKPLVILPANFKQH